MPKAIDLFAGPGGLSMGLSMAGFDLVGAVEWDPDAGRTYRHNIGGHVHVRDLKGFPPEEMEECLVDDVVIEDKKDIELISGGPPCPGFSTIGRSKISNLILTGQWEGSDHRHRFIDDPRNQLFREFVDYVGHFLPSHFLMENVSGLVSYRSTEELPMALVITQEFEALGYRVKHRILNASEYGVPQSRKRIFFLGWREGEEEPHWPEKSAGVISASDAIDDLPSVSPDTGKPSSDSLAPLGSIRGSSVKKGFLRWARKQQTPTGNRTPRCACTLHETRAVNPRDRGIFPLIESGDEGERTLYKDVWPSKRKEIEELLPEGYSMVCEEDGKWYVIGERWGRTRKWGWYDPSKFGDKMRRIRGDSPAPTVVAHLAKDGYMFIHPYEHRTITVREAARFQSFPDSFDFSAGGSNSITSQFRQVGNAVPPLLAKILGESIKEAIDRGP